MSIKNLKNEFFQVISEKLLKLGFKKKPSQDSFYRFFEGGWAAIHTSCINHSEDFDVVISFSVRNDKVEDLVNSNNSLLSKKKALTSTVGVELGNLLNIGQKRWSIYSSENIPEVADSILSDVCKYGEPYLLKYSSLDSMYELLCSDEKEVWVHSPFHATRAKKAIAIAKLLGKPDIDKKIEIKKQFLEKIKDFGLSDFIAFTNRLF